MATDPIMPDRLDVPRRRPQWWARRFPNTVFYTGVGAVVLEAAAAASREECGRAELGQFSDRIMEVLKAIGTPVQVENAEVFGTFEGPCVIVGNHMSTLETFVLPGLIIPYKPVTFVVKRSLVDYPVFGKVMRAFDPVVVGRAHAREDLKAMIDGGRARIAKGTSLVVFPQTTRTTTFRRDQFNSIGVKLARREGVPVVPLALLTDAWQNGRLIKDFGPVDPNRPVRFCFGNPITVGSAEREAHQQVVEFIESRLQAWRDGLVAPV